MSIRKKIQQKTNHLIRCGLLLLSVFAFSGIEIMAQTGGFAGSYNRMGFGARGMGMGNAMNAVYQQGIYAHYNPALAAMVTDTQFDLSMAAMSFDRSLNSANAAFQLPPSAGINIGIQHAGVGNFDGRSLSGNPTETFSTNEFNVFVAFGLNASEKVSLGFSAKLLYADFFQNVNSQFGFGIDLGALYRPNEQLSFGFSIRDMLSAYNWDTSNLYGTQGATSRNKFPVRFTLGAAYNFINTGLLVSAETEIQMLRSEAQRAVESTGVGGAPIFRTTRESIMTNAQLLRVGASYDLHERVTLRGGWQINDLENAGDSHLPSIGFSLHLPFNQFNPSIDYTFIREPEGISYMHAFALRFSL
jgi:hypothetical protein